MPSAVRLAGELYWYAVTHISGPRSPRISLDEVLSSWKLPVPALSAAQQRTATLASVISAAGDSILGQKSVHIVITSRSAGSAGTQRIAADIGTAAGAESITGSAGRAAIRVTGHAAYFTGDQSGLTAYIGLPAAAAARVRSRWVEIKSGSAEYQDLAAEDTMAALPASLLPAASNSVRMRTGSVSGQQVYVLTWKATPTESSESSGSRHHDQRPARADGRPYGAAGQRDAHGRRPDQGGDPQPLGRAVRRPGAGIDRPVLSPGVPSLSKGVS